MLATGGLWMQISNFEKLEMRGGVQQYLYLQHVCSLGGISLASRTTTACSGYFFLCAVSLEVHSLC